MQVMDDWRDALGFLGRARGLAAVIYIAQTLRGEVRPHPLCWSCSEASPPAMVQRDEGARQGSWTLLSMTDLLSVRRRQRRRAGSAAFPAGSGRSWPRAARCSRYLSTRQADHRGMRGRADDARRRARLRADIRPRLVAAEERQRGSFALNGVKFIPS